MSDSQVREYRPDKTAAVWLPLGLTGVVVGGGAGFVALLAALDGELLAAVIVLSLAALVVGVAALSLLARWRKSVFTLSPGRFVARTGGLFSDASVELAARNVTFCRYERPFLERVLLGTGTVRVESAGSGGSEIVMFAVRDPGAVFEDVLSALRGSGFPLAMDVPVQEHRVSGVGMAVDMVQTTAGIFIFILVVLADLFEDRQTDVVVALVVAGLALLFGFLVAGARLLDLRARRYRLFEGAVDFEEGFFNLRRTVIPMENVADSEAEQGLAGRLFGFWDVKVSCQGAGKEIRFAYLTEGRRLMEGVDRAVERTRARDDAADDEGGKTASVAGGAPPAGAAPGRKAVGREIFRGDRAFKGTFRQNLLRALAPAAAALLGAALGASLVGGLMALDGSAPGEVAGASVAVFIGLSVVAGIMVVKGLVGAYMTTYEVTEDSLVSAFSFIVTKRTEFSFDKVTSVATAESPLDWIFGTHSLEVTSIGSATKLTVAHQVASDALRTQLLRKVGIETGKAVDELRPSWSASAFLRSPEGSTAAVFLVLVALGGALLATESAVASVVVMVLAGLSMAASAGVSRLGAGYRSLELAPDHVAGREGILFRRHITVPFRSVKGLQASRYLAGSDGDLTVDIAGELVVATNAQAQAAAAQSGGPPGIVRSHGFTLPYVQDVATLLDELDGVVAADEAERAGLLPLPRTGRSVAAAVERMTAAPGLGRFMTPRVMGASIPCLALAVGGVAGEVPALAVVAALAFVAFVVLFGAQGRSTRYAVDAGRVRMDWGVFFRARKTVAFRHVDFIAAEQGMLDKLFGVGSLRVHTTGSSGAELSLDGFAEHRPFEAALKEKY